jgi:hypothetical protein
VYDKTRYKNLGVGTCALSAAGTECERQTKTDVAVQVPHSPDV